MAHTCVVQVLHQSLHMIGGNCGSEADGLLRMARLCFSGSAHHGWELQKRGGWFVEMGIIKGSFDRWTLMCVIRWKLQKSSFIRQVFCAVAMNESFIRGIVKFSINLD